MRQLKERKLRNKTLGVLARWFRVDPSDNSLSVLTSVTHGPLPISQYRLTIPHPDCVDNKYYLQPNVYDSISDLLSSYGADE